MYPNTFVKDLEARTDESFKSWSASLTRGGTTKIWTLALRSSVSAVALATLVAGVTLAPPSAHAANECGGIPAGPNSTVDCSGAFGNGIEYEPGAGNEVFTLNIGDGTIPGAAAVVAPDILTFGQTGVFVADFNFLGIPVGGVPATTIINIGEFSQVEGSMGVTLWTDGTGNDATVNNSGTVLATGSGNASTGIGINVIAGNPLGGPAGSGNATAFNSSTGVINAAGNAINVWLLDGDATATNDGALTSSGGSGIVIADPIFGAIPTLGAGTATNNGTINAAVDGIFVESTGNASATNTGEIIAGDNGIEVYTGGTSTLTADSSGEIHAGNDGMNLTNLGTGGVTATNSGALTAGNNGIVASGGGGTVDVSSSAGGTVGFGGDNIPFAVGLGALNFGGDANVTVGDKISYGGVDGTFSIGAAAVSIGGDSSVAVNVDIDPPFIGVVSIGNNSVVDVADGMNVEAVGLGIFSLALSGDSDINGANSNIISGGVGIVATSFGGNSYVDSGAVTSADSGVISTAFGGNSEVTSHGKIDAGGLFGISSTAFGGDSIVSVNADIDPPVIGVFSAGINSTVNVADGMTIEATALGISSTAFGGDSDINAANSIIDSGGVGVVGTSFGGNSYVDSGAVTSVDSGVISTAFGGDSVINTHGKIDAGGTFGALSTSFGGNATVNVNAAIDPPLVGAQAIAFGPGDATVTAAAGAPIEAFILGAGAIQIGSGNASVTTNDTVMSDVFGVGTLKIGDGNSTIAVNEAVSGLTGARTFNAINAVNLFGDGDVTVTTGGGADSMTGADGGTLLADNDAVSITKVLGGGKITVGLNADATAGDEVVDIFRTLSGSTGSTIEINVGQTSVANLVAETGNGIQVVAPFAFNDVNVNVHEGSSVVADDGSAISISTFSVFGPNAVSIENAGLLQGEGSPFFVPTIEVATNGAVNIHNDTTGEIRSDGGSAFASIIQSIAGDTNNVVNDGTMTGNMQLFSANGNTVENNSSTTWNTAGLNLFISGGDNTINNTDDGTINTGALTTFLMIGPGTNTVNNTGVININADGDDFGFGSATAFVGVPGQNLEFNNAGGLLNMSNGIAGFGLLTPATYPGFLGGPLGPYQNDIGDITFIAGNFNGGPGSEMAIDVVLDGPATSASDLLIVGFPGSGSGSTTGSTGIFVNDVNPGAPGSFNPEGILVAAVDDVSDPDAFFLVNGPIDKGLFTYDLYRVETDSVDWLLASGPDQTFFELPSIVTAAQDMWHNAAGVWLDRTADLRSAMMTSCAAPVASGKGLAAPACTTNVTPGAWAKVLGNTLSREDNHSFTVLNQTSSFKVDSRLDGWGIVGGYDFGKEMQTASGPSAWMVGIMGGYIGSELDFKDSTTTVDFETGLVGAYLTYLQGGWFVDGKIVANIGNYEYQNATPTGLQSNDKQDVVSIGGVIDTGYRFGFAKGFIEPGATLSYVNTDVDNPQVYGNDVSLNGESLRGRLGLRIGTSFISGGHKIEPFIGGGAWYEFDGDNSASIVSNGIPLVANDDVGGVIGEVTGGLNLFSLNNSGWSGFVKGNVQFGEDDLVGFGGNAGLRKSW